MSYIYGIKDETTISLVDAMKHIDDLLMYARTNAADEVAEPYLNNIRSYLVALAMKDPENLNI